MHTPYGADCPEYYADFNRGRNIQECRLPRQGGGRWTVDLCQTCPVPRLRQANSCPNLALTGTVQSGFLGIGRKMTVTAHCPKSAGPVAEPAIGCGHCHDDSPPLTFTLGE